MVVHPSVSSGVGTSVASESGVVAREEHLRSDVDVGPGSLSGDLDAIGESRGGSVGPAGATVFWDVLVSDVGEVVSSFNVVPDPLRGEIVHISEWLADERVLLVGLMSDPAWGVVADSTSLNKSAEQSSGSESFHLYCLIFIICRIHALIYYLVPHNF